MVFFISILFETFPNIEYDGSPGGCLVEIRQDLWLLAELSAPAWVEIE